MWRPEGWENPYPDLIRNGSYYGDARVWEDGADAMFEAIYKAIKEEDDKEHFSSLFSIGYGSVLQFLDGEGFE